MSNTEVMVLDSPLSDDVWDQLSDPDHDAPLALAINASLEDFEVQFGPVTGLEGEDQDSTLPWNPQDLNIMQVYCRTKTFTMLQNIFMSLLIYFMIY